jgi:uncharacterized tellurite resistance protein B-like protein
MEQSQMSPSENLHYAIGMIAFTIANADGKVQKEEREKFHGIVEAELRCKDMDFDVSEIIFLIMAKEPHDTETSYNWAMNTLRNNSHYLSPELKKTFIKVIEKIAMAYPPITAEENTIIKRFKADIEPLIGDPIYYRK